MAELSSVLFSIGVIFVALGFAAHVGHAVMLANGRRAALPALAAARQPAYAGVVTGSFVTNRPGPRPAGPTLAASPSPLSRAATGLTRRWPRRSWAPRCSCAASSSGRGPWGNMFEFTVAFSFSMITGYLLLARRYAIRSIGFIPLGVALALLLYASSLPSEIEPLVPALQNAAAADDPRRDGGPLVRDLRDRVRGRRRATSSRARTTGSPGCRRTRSSTRSPTGRSSSASRSSRR